MGNLESVRMLLRASVKIDSRNEISKTPMHLAAENGHVPLVVTHAHTLTCTRTHAHTHTHTLIASLPPSLPVLFGSCYAINMTPSRMRTRTPTLLSILPASMAMWVWLKH